MAHGHDSINARMTKLCVDLIFKGLCSMQL